MAFSGGNNDWFHRMLIFKDYAAIQPANMAEKSISLNPSIPPQYFKEKNTDILCFSK